MANDFFLKLFPHSLFQWRNITFFNFLIIRSLFASVDQNSQSQNSRLLLNHNLANYLIAYIQIITYFIMFSLEPELLTTFKFARLALGKFLDSLYYIYFLINKPATKLHFDVGNTSC